MRKIMTCIITMVFLLVVCTSRKESGQIFAAEGLSETEAAGSGQTADPSTTAAVDSQKVQEPDRGFTAEIGKKIGPMLSEKIDTSKRSVYTYLYPELASWATKGDDGSCYYFRNEGKGKNEKLVFYKNNGIKVCETTIEKSIKEKYYICSFVKYGSRFFLAFNYIDFDDYDNNHKILTTIDMETGKWGEVIDVPNDYDWMMVYEGCFYCKGINGSITRYDLSGEKLKLNNVAPDGFEQHIQCIVDGKIYYIVMQFGSGKATRIMRSNLDGSGKETLFKYSKWSGEFIPGSLQIDGDYMYLAGDFGKLHCLARIPLYGGKIKKVVEIADKHENWFALSDDSIFLYKNKGHSIYKVNKNLRGKAKTVTKVYYPKSYKLAAPHYYADGHLMMQGYNKKEHKIVNNLLHNIVVDCWTYADVKENYADDYYWVNEDGEVEDVIKGSGLKKDWTY